MGNALRQAFVRQQEEIARTEDFKALAHDLAMQIAATNPKYIEESELPAGSEDNPKEVCLLAQPFIKCVRDNLTATGFQTCLYSQGVSLN